MDNTTKNAYLDLIEQHLSQNLLDEALQAFKKLDDAANLGLQDNLTAQSAALSRAQNDYHFKKTITREQFGTEEAKVMNALQMLSRRIKDMDMDAPSNTSVAPLPPIFNDQSNTKFLLLCDPADAPSAQLLAKHLFMLRRSGKLDLFNPHDAPSGNHLLQTIELAANRANYLLLLVSPNLFNAGDQWLNIAERAMANGKMVVPIRLAQTDLEGTKLAGIAGLPPLGRSVNEFTNPDEAYTEIAEGIKRLLPRG